MPDPESTTFVQRIVLCCLTQRTESDRGPADAAELRTMAKDLLETAEDPPAGIGSVSEGDIARALNGLAGDEFVEEIRPEDRSPVGKGRPKYDLDVDPDEIRAALDDEVGSLLE